GRIVPRTVRRHVLYMQWLSTPLAALQSSLAESGVTGISGTLGNGTEQRGRFEIQVRIRPGIITQWPTTPFALKRSCMVAVQMTSVVVRAMRLANGTAFLGS